MIYASFCFEQFPSKCAWLPGPRPDPCHARGEGLTALQRSPLQPRPSPRSAAHKNVGGRDLRLSVAVSIQPECPEPRQARARARAEEKSAKGLKPLS